MALKPKNALKDTFEVIDFCKKREIDKGVIPYKGGYGVILNKKVKFIFNGEDAKEKAEEKLSNL